ncbi:UPF0528 protein CG10038 [Eumeta japonica]|uniref:UPF0528 protein CG10038 n=1 Tax=Eumeta variegata TaxID=151549 RepID=A0A4C1YXD6_EUMVA|nr:UPF0528 protein CG10038 [Eumeta japonica]
MANIKALGDFGYGFNDEGQLRKLDKTGYPGEEPFQFSVSDNHQECQRHYEELGEAVTKYVYDTLENDLMLTRMPVPEQCANGTFIFVSKEYELKDRLLVLIHGSGVVRAGQWARSLIINDKIDSGTQIPYIKKAVENGFGVLIMNTNDNHKANGDTIPKSGSPEEHASYVWDNYISKTKASAIAIVAHSYGGIVVMDLANKYKDDFQERVKAIAFTDSVHGYSKLKVTKYLKKVAKNWVASNNPLDSPVSTPDHEIIRVSAGHPKHELTSYSCINSVFKFIEEKIPN